MAPASEALPIGGWLVVVALGLVLTPFAVLRSLSSFVALFANGQFSDLLDRGSLSYNPAWAVFVVVEVLANLGLLGLTVYSCVRFFQRKRSVPRLMIRLYGLSLGLALIDVSVPPLISSAELTLETALPAGSALVRSAVWMSYFRFSKRVRRTFVL